MNATGEHAEPGGGGEAFRLLFVCTGNTCRSPLAQAVAAEEVRRRGWSQVEVHSAGVAAAQGVPASPEAVRVATEAGLDLAQHRSSTLSQEEVERADLILAMSPSHLVELERMGVKEKAALITVFAEGREDAEVSDRGVDDPIGGDREEYRRTLHQLQRLVSRTLDRLEPVLAP